MRKSYPSDISREQFEAIKPLLESACKRTTRRKVDLYEVFCGVLYLLRSGCQWRLLPEEFPKGRPVHSYWAIWSEPRAGSSLLERALKNQVGAAREKLGRSASSTFLIVEAQSVKNTGTVAHIRVMTSARRSRASSATLAVDTQGLPHASAVTTAEVTDRKERGLVGTAALQSCFGQGVRAALRRRLRGKILCARGQGNPRRAGDGADR